MCAVRYSSASRLLSLIPDELQRAHHSEPGEQPSPVQARVQAQSLWDGWQDAEADGGLAGVFC